MKARVSKDGLPKYCFKKNDKIWVRMKDASGAWKNTPTGLPLTPKGIEQAAQLVKKTLRKLEAAQEQGIENLGALTVQAYYDRWIADREARGLVAVLDDRTRMKHALPHLGALVLDQVRPRHVRELVRALEVRRQIKEGIAPLSKATLTAAKLPLSSTIDDVRAVALAPRTILHVYSTVHNMFESAVVEELIEVNLVKVAPGELPSKIDNDPEWRANATYTTAEIVRLISDPRIPAERRVAYALKAIAGMRHGEVAALCWRHYDDSLQPLGRLLVAQAWCSRTSVVKRTKSEEVRSVPVHPTLARILKAWREAHWQRVYGRAPTPDDFIVPTRTFRCVAGKDAVVALKRDLATLELRVEAGDDRDRGGHDLRSWYKTQTIEDDADSLIIRRTTHAPPKDVNAGYERFSWETICREVAKLKIELPVGEVIPLVTDSLLAESKARGRWRNVVTPKGLEPDKTHARANVAAHSSSGNAGAAAMTAGERALAVTRSLLALEEAIKDGRLEAALDLAKAAKQVAPPVPPASRARVERER